jgi:tRNA-dihydrouridine synthase
MVGRAAVRQPWIFAQAREIEKKRALSPGLSSVPENGLCSKNQALSPCLEKTSFVPDIEKTGLRFLELLALYQPPEFHLSRAKRFFGFFCDNLKWGNYLKNRLNREETLTGIERAWSGYFKEEGAGEKSFTVL